MRRFEVGSRLRNYLLDRCSAPIGFVYIFQTAIRKIVDAKFMAMFCADGACSDGDVGWCKSLVERSLVSSKRILEVSIGTGASDPRLTAC
jgi:hypothetical protein